MVTVFSFEEEGGTAALKLSVRHDGDPVAQQVGLLHEVGGQQQGTTGPLPLTVTRGQLRSPQVISGHLRSPQVTTGHRRPFHITKGHFRSQQFDLASLATFPASASRAVQHHIRR